MKEARKQGPKGFDVFESPDGQQRVEFRFFSNDQKTRFFGVIQREPGGKLSEFWFPMTMLEGWEKVYNGKNDTVPYLWRR